MVFFVIIVIIFLNVVCGRSICVVNRCGNLSKKDNRITIRAEYAGVYYLLNWGSLVVVIVFLLRLIGFYDWIHLSRAFASGSTFFLMLLSLPMFPLFIKTSLCLSPNWQDKLLYIFAVLFVLSFSRILAIFHVLMAIIIYFYARIGSGEISIRKYRMALCYGGVLLFFMFFVYGSYKHVIEKVGSAGLVNIFGYVWEHPEDSMFSLDVNYKLGIEAMSGLSGVLTRQMDGGSIHADFGLSALGGGFLQLMPSLFRRYFGDLPQTIHSLYYYQQGIVASGLEGFFVHFSFLGFIFYPIVFYLCSSCIHQKLLLLNRRGGCVYRQRLFLAIIAVYGLQIIRGSTETLITFTVTEIIIMVIAVWFFRFFHVAQKESYENSN